MYSIASSRISSPFVSIGLGAREQAKCVYSTRVNTRWLRKTKHTWPRGDHSFQGGSIYFNTFLKYIDRGVSIFRGSKYFVTDPGRGQRHCAYGSDHPLILPCSLAAGGRSLAALQKWQHVCGQQLFHPSVLPQLVDRRSYRLLPHNRASLISVREFVGGGGGA